MHLHLLFVSLDPCSITGRIILDRDISWDSLTRSWIFGNNYDIPNFQDAAMNAMIEKTDHFLNSDKLHYIYKNTEQRSALRRLFRDRFTIIFYLDRSKDWFGGKKDDYPPDFLIDVHRRAPSLARELETYEG